MLFRAVVLGFCAALSGCAMASDVMDTGNGTYLISARASPARGGAAGANQVAYKDAQAFCGKQGARPIVIVADSRDSTQASFGGSGGSFGGGVFQAGNTDLRFRCAKD